MHDLVTRNGEIVDGTGKPAFIGDVALDGGFPLGDPPDYETPRSCTASAIAASSRRERRPT